MHVVTECPHCRRKGHTPQIIKPGARLRCPKCGQIFRLPSEGASLVDTMPDDRERMSLLIEDRPLARWHRSATAADAYQLADALDHGPRPPGPPSTRTIFTSPMRKRTANHFRPIEQARSFLGVLVIALVAMAVTAFSYGYARLVDGFNPSAVPGPEQRQAGPQKDFEVPTKMPELPARKAIPFKTNERVPTLLAVEKGGYSMLIRDVEVGSIRINKIETPTRHLTVRIEVTNLSGQPFEYRGWHHAGASCTLRGPLNRTYSMFVYKGSQLPEGCVRTVWLRPREVVRDMIIFEESQPRADWEPGTGAAPAPTPGFRALPVPHPPRDDKGGVGAARPYGPACHAHPEPVVVASAGRSPRGGKDRAEADRRWDVVDKAARRKSRVSSVDFYKRERGQDPDELFDKHQIDRDELRSIAPYLFKL